MRFLLWVGDGVGWGWGGDGVGWGWGVFLAAVLFDVILRSMKVIYYLLLCCCVASGGGGE